MKQDSTLRFLAGLQVILALFVTALCALHIYYTRVTNRHAMRLAESNHNRRVYDLMLAASIEYAGRQPAIHPTLAAVGVKITTNAPAKPNPAKPAR